MPDSLWKDNAKLARRVVREGTDVLKTVRSRAIRVNFIGNLALLSVEEHNALKKFQKSIESYIKDVDNPEHPLCLGVFGPPGCGKSFAVKQLLTSLKLNFRTINISQLPGPSDLSAALTEVVRWSGKETPVVFFDEFDARLDGADLGWLQWMLVMMQDGFIVDHYNEIPLKKAVFVFAGGTADTFEEFSAVTPGFRKVKGPDFVSRLRGHLNIKGPNDWPYRRVRRAVVLRLAIQRSARGLLDSSNMVPAARLANTFLDQLLAVGRYRHGSRSVDALLEMSVSPSQDTFVEKDLPPQNVLANHVDLGTMGNVAAALSAGGSQISASAGDYDSVLEAVWTRVATQLLEMGAGLVYGGDVRSGGFTQLLAQAEESLPVMLGSTAGSGTDTGPFSRPHGARVTWVRPEWTASGVAAPPFPRVDIRLSPGLTPEELKELSLTPNTDLSTFDAVTLHASPWMASEDMRKWLGYSLTLFRMRALISRVADAHLVFGGALTGFRGRFPGIAEEVMLSLTSGNAVYICGGFGGAAEAVGQLLGLGEPWAVVPECLQISQSNQNAELLQTAVSDWKASFQMPYGNNLPISYEELVAYLRDHAIDGPKWPKNGLSAEENRVLFRSTDPDEIVNLLLKGLHTRFKTE